ncbi:MAG: tol-pal system protein YbgF [Desulfatiglans sp.]|jgi:tol-pal system protein YbgF|nr:tol-pal system protein YbgF [Thermodesulfobacteriota bacterium]MEE4352747.1 tol-pal system protein YbgF [Desulfatiglans sp.]
MTRLPVLKKVTIANLGILVCLVLFCPSCVTSREDILYLNDQIVALNKRVSQIEESIGTKLSGKLDSSLQSIRNNQAELVAENDLVKSEIQSLSGRVEEAEHLLKRAIERDTTDQDAIKAGINDLTQRLSKLEAGGVQLREGREKGNLAKGLGPKIAGKESSPVAQTISSESEVYDLALSAFKAQEYGEAIVRFKKFLEKYGKSDLADNAQFWIGECYMSLQQYEQAILAFQQVIKKYPKGNKVPNAMLRQAVAFYEINDRISARLLLKKIIKNYPGSSEAKTAESKLKTLK